MIFDIHLFEEAKWYSQDVVGISSTKRRGSSARLIDTIGGNFVAAVEPTKFIRAGVGILVYTQLGSCIGECISLGQRFLSLFSRATLALVIDTRTSPNLTSQSNTKTEQSVCHYTAFQKCVSAILVNLLRPPV